MRLRSLREKPVSTDAAGAARPGPQARRPAALQTFREEGFFHSCQAVSAVETAEQRGPSVARNLQHIVYSLPMYSECAYVRILDLMRRASRIPDRVAQMGRSPLDTLPNVDDAHQDLQPGRGQRR